MSRIGKQPVKLPSGVSVNIGPESVEVKGPKGSLQTRIPRGITIEQQDDAILFHRGSDTKEDRSLHGLARSLIANAVQGVHEGFKKELDIIGVGYKAQVEGKKVVFNLGHSHQKEVPIPEGVDVQVEKATHIVVTGHDKQKVGQVAAVIRSLRKPDPYKSKGVKYTDEIISKKAGKAAK